MIEQSLLEKVINDNIELNIREAFVQEGHAVPNISDFISFISELYKHHPPDKITWNFSCFITTNNIDTSKGTVVHKGEVFNNFSKDVAIVLLNESMCLLCDFDSFTLEEPFLVYVFENLLETIWANNKKIPIINPDSTSYSIFARATFKDLEESLRKYYNNRAKFSLCPEIQKCWLDEYRIKFRPSPEHSLRDSLWLFLRDVLRGDPDVKREQNVDESKPVDIKVSWKWVKAIALIEIKWLGYSFNETTRKRTQAFSSSRAISGADQLQNYIKLSQTECQDTYFDGYLVVFDARRQRVTSIDSIPNEPQATHFRDKEIPYPDCYQDDQCLKLEYRFFLEPKIS